MFLSRFAERSGLFGILAPRRSKDANKKNKGGGEDDADEGKSNDNGHDEAVAVDTSGDDEPQEQESQETILRKRRLDYQQKMEVEAESRGAFCKKQRVKYHNRIQDTWDDAVIVGVHFDDGPDNPYYTIRYRKEDFKSDADGNTGPIWVEVEKQTTPDRLQRVPFDPDASWELLK